MTPRTRAALALAGTLVLGLGLGTLLGSRLAARRFERLNALSHPPMIVDLLRERLDLSAGQRAVVDSILAAQAVQVGERIRQHRELMRSQMDSLLQSLKPHLSEEQWTRLQEQLRRPPRFDKGRKGGKDGFRGDHGPGGPGGPADLRDLLSKEQRRQLRALLDSLDEADTPSQAIHEQVGKLLKSWGLPDPGDGPDPRDWDDHGPPDHGRDRPEPRNP